MRGKEMERERGRGCRSRRAIREKGGQGRVGGIEGLNVHVHVVKGDN